MASKISEEEFIRLQNQLIELRTANYTLEEKHARQLSRSLQLQSRLEALEREYCRVQNALSLMRNLKNADLISQNEALQQKLQVQEDEFRLQNQTLMQELSNVIQEKGNIMREKEVIAMDTMFEAQEKVISIQSECNALESALSEEKIRSAHEISKLKNALQVFSKYMDDSLRREMLGNGDNVLTLNREGDVCEPRAGGHDRLEIMQEHVQGEGDSTPENEFTLISSSRLAQLQLAEAMQETERLKEEKDKRMCVELLLKKTEEEYYNYKAITEKKVRELEETFQHAGPEREMHLKLISEYSAKNGEMGVFTSQLQSQIRQMEIDNEGRHVKMMEAMKMIADLDQQVTGCTSKIQQKELTITMMEKALRELSEERDRLKNDKELQVGVLEQKLADMEAELSLRERKGIIVCRDLRRQLAAERKRVERLQERMREVLEGKLGAESCRVADIDVTSISSWSLMSGNLEPPDGSTGDNSLVAGSPTNANGNVYPQPDELDLEQENRNLLERVAHLQEEKWALEEKVNQVEQANAVMVQDLATKSEVIKFYCMEGRPEPQPSTSGKKGVKKLSDFLKTSEDEHLQECNIKMQRMLEELLTKNMYLQRDLENFSKKLENRYTASSD